MKHLVNQIKQLEGLKIYCSIFEKNFKVDFSVTYNKSLAKGYSFKKLLVTPFVHKSKNESPHLLVMIRVEIFCSDLDLYLSEKCVSRGLMNLFEISKYYLKESTWNLEVSKEVIINVYCQNWAKLGVSQMIIVSSL